MKAANSEELQRYKNQAYNPYQGHTHKATSIIVTSLLSTSLRQYRQPANWALLEAISEQSKSAFFSLVSMWPRTALNIRLHLPSS